ncbi:FRG domain-containing protein [Paucibacter sp. R3-3]|uniref:FRG domain-containing protein n=1 Tax=Roseateles agri TaxID=3098619 RepID=A0ABU5DS74_9BURK|nr:FRG domain-containing protein [Paucibacter sp. R3-3]MDY0748094.1 FRG domain-containing protein [Paucibacter sp. R3-3]
METLEIRSWAHFVECVDALDGCAFRGQRVADWPLASSLYRRLLAYCPDKATWPEREARALRIFRRKAHIYLADPQVLDDDLRCLAMMQHHGAPTRLLDFTKSPFVAAFFALERSDGNAAVFSLDTPALWKAAPALSPDLRRDVIDPRRPGNFARYFAMNDRPVLWCGEPARMDSRLVAQSGLFVVPGQIQQPLDQILAHYDAPVPLLKRLVIRASLRNAFMRELYRMNITDATLFPDLDGLARSIAFELEVVWSGGVSD